ncbi:MAG: AMP-binding protein [Silvanigrellaceae bacterium]
MPAPNGNCTIRAFEKMNTQPERLAIWSLRHGTISFRGLGEMASGQQRICTNNGIVGGDVVVVMALPSPSLYAAMVALMGLGCPVVFIEPWMPAIQIEQVVASLSPKALFVDTFGLLWSLRSRSLRSLRKFKIDERADGFPDASILQIHPVDPARPAIYSFTTGTTGTPKGVVRTHEYLWNLHETIVKYSDESLLDGPDLTIFPNLVLFHIGAGRGSLLVPANWSLTALQRIRELSRELLPQSLSCGPAFLKRLLDYNLHPPSLKSIHVGGAMIECELLEAAVKAFPRSSIKQVYGGTEVEPIAICEAHVSLENSRQKGFVHALNVGFPIQELKSTWDENGVLWVAGPNVCPEYVGGGDANKRNKRRDAEGVIWHRTGDRILQDDKGFWYAGRAEQPLDDFLFEQKLYARLGHSRAFLHRDSNSNGIIVADDSVRHIEQVASDIGARKFQVWRSIILRDRRHRSRIDRLGTWRKGLRMQRWWIYLRERSPLMVLVLLSAGPLVSGLFLAQVHGQCPELPRGVCLQGQPSLFLAGLSIFSSVLFMVLARMMDELKDHEKDKQANPGRPLPRGLISPAEMNRGVVLLFFVLLAASAAHLFFSAPLQAMLMGVSAIYLWLMYKEFYIGSFLAAWPLAYALSHQMVGVPLYLYGVSLFSPAFIQQDLAWFYVGINVCASISYEFTRKLKSDAHPAARTYRQIYGLNKAAAIALAFQFGSFLLALTTYRNGIPAVLPLMVVQSLASCMILLQAWRDAHHKSSEGVSALAVLAAAWVGLFSLFRF